MNSGQDANPDRPAADASEPADAADASEASEPVDAAEATDAFDPKSEALQRSQDAIDEGREAAREALQDNPPGADLSEPGEPES
jgi:hypothetical protein